MSIEYSAKEESTLLSITKSNYNFACRKVYDIGILDICAIFRIFTLVANLCQ